MPQLFDTGLFSVQGANGSTGAGWKLNFYASGTTTRLDTYPTRANAIAGTNPNANPVICDQNGRFPPIWLKDVDYKCVLTDETGVVKVPRDPVNGNGVGDADGASRIGYSAGGSGAVTRSAFDKFREYISVADYGADGVGAESVEIQKAANAAYAAKLPLHFQAENYTFTSVDFKGVDLISDTGSALTGDLVNAGEIIGITLGGYSTSDYVSATLPPLDCGGLIVAKYRTIAADGDDGWYVISQNPRRSDYVAVRMRAAPASDTGPWELIREQSVFSCVEAFAYQSIRTASGRVTYTGAGWADYDYTAAVLGFSAGVSSGPEGQYALGRRTTGSGESVQITVTPDANGVVSLAFLGTTTSTNSVTLAWNGQTMPVNTQVAAGSTLLRMTFNSGLFKPFVLTITNNQAAYLYLIGVNVDRPQNVRAGIGYDQWAYYTRPTEDSYAINNGATEYALRDMDAGSFVGSYHGREAALTPAVWSLDGVDVSAWTKNVPQVATRAVSLRQKTLINSKLTSNVEHKFGDGWVEYLVDLSGTMRASTVYIGMCKPQAVNVAAGVDCFTEILYPQYRNVKAEALYAFGHSELFVWRNTRTGQRVYAWQRVFPKSSNVRGGGVIETAYGTTTYAKLRTGLQVDSEQSFTGATAHFIHLYC